ncbi:DUF421 domain-containing protein [Erythrobacter sp.]|uniref:DUF421 domain-containing protein n=1 Tax=Erythrobacter sp. TaxID=1042 RepID=UPI002E9E8718|nr:YetF domain-containing protein [Erythrobacter sp.]
MGRCSRQGRAAIFVEPPIADALLRGVILAILALAWLNLLIRVNGLRTLSKMTNFDFVTTVAFGSLLAGAGQASDLSAFVQVLAAMLGLIIAQATTASLRRRSEIFDDVVGNQPCLIMRDGEFNDEGLKANNIRREDMIAKLREANVLDLSRVRAAILETTGDVSVLHGEGQLDDILLQDVRGT